MKLTASMKYTGAACNVTHFESRITHSLHTAINTTEHGLNVREGVSKNLSFQVPP